MDVLINILFSLGTVYLAVVVFMFLFQRKLLYHPVREMGPPKAYGFGRAEEVKIVTEDGQTLRAWHVPPTTKRHTILYFHGNRGNLANRTHKLAALTHEGYGLLGVSWRGFGGSTGRPSEKGLLEDAKAALRWLQIPAKHVIVYGESLGSGAVVQLANEFPIFLTVLEAPYLSIRKRAQELYPWLPVGIILRDNFDSSKHIESMQSPLVIIHGAEDEVMPVEHAKELFAKAREPKTLIIYPHVGHTDFSHQQIIDPLNAAVAQLENHKPQ